MRRQLSLGLAVAVCGAAMLKAADQAVNSGVQRVLVNALGQMDDVDGSRANRVLSKLEIDTSAVRRGDVLSAEHQLEVQQQIEDRLKPMPIEDGMLTAPLGQPLVGLLHTLTDQERVRLLDRARSIGRVETAVGTDYVLKGTGFVVASDTIATNCHVLSQIGVLGGDGWKITGTSRIDFGDGALHDLKNEFEIVSVKAVPTLRGLDVALLQVKTSSLEGATPLPAKLTLRNTALEENWSAGASVPVGVVGYPDLLRATESNFLQLKRLGLKRYGKVYSPGSVINVFSSSRDLSFILHVAGTTGGYSGAPLLSLDTGEVIGVHNCCTAAGTVDGVSAVPCADIIHVPAASNEAISSWNLTANETLAPFLAATASGASRPPQRDAESSTAAR